MDCIEHNSHGFSVCRIHAGLISPRVTPLVAKTGADLCGARPSKVYMAMAAFRLLRPGPLAADRQRERERHAPHKNALRNRRSREKGGSVSIKIGQQHQTSPSNGQLRVIQEVVDRNEPDRRPGRAGHQWHHLTATCRQGAHAVR